MPVAADWDDEYWFLLGNWNVAGAMNVLAFLTKGWFVGSTAGGPWTEPGVGDGSPWTEPGAGAGNWTETPAGSDTWTE